MCGCSCQCSCTEDNNIWGGMQSAAYEASWSSQYSIQRMLPGMRLKFLQNAIAELVIVD